MCFHVLLGIHNTSLIHITRYVSHELNSYMKCGDRTVV